MSQKVKQQRNTNHGFARMTCLLELHGIARTGQEDSFHGVARKHEQLLGRCTDLHVTARKLPVYLKINLSSGLGISTWFRIIFQTLFRPTFPSFPPQRPPFPFPEPFPADSTPNGPLFRSRNRSRPCFHPQRPPFPFLEPSGRSN